MGERVTLVEMGPRDGLQNEAVHVPTAQKVALIDGLSACGFDRIEAASFVSPKWVPQMADGAEVMAGITRKDGVRYGALTPNLRGFHRALRAGVDEVAIFGSASEGFSRANLNCSVDESLQMFAPVMDAAKDAGIPVRGYVSCVTDCPFEGAVDPEAVARVAKVLRAMGCYEISLGDTIGHGTPKSVASMLEAVLEIVPAAQLAGHFHDTRGSAVENIHVCMDHGLRVFDTAIAGLGGCPYAPGAQGNVATERVADALQSAGYDTGLDAEALAGMVRVARGLRGME